MTTKSFVLGAASAMAILAATSAASAQSAAPAPALVQGPPIAGLCILSVRTAISSSTVGQYVSNRLSQLAQQVKAELGPEETSLNADGKALEAQRTTLSPADFQTKGAALQARFAALQQKANQRQAEMEATERKAINRITQELDPIGRQVYQQNHCSILIDKDSLVLPSSSTDLTVAVVTGLNARIQQFAFEREHLDSAPAR
jgi:outer membrane protein